MMNLLRFDETYAIDTKLDPIEDILNLISTLKSLGFTSDLLHEVHGFNDSIEIKKTAKLISLHINNAIGLANQGLSGYPETSFLTLYYSTLNLQKVHLLLLGKRKELEKNRWHGAQYIEKEMSRNFLNEKIKIKANGTIPLIYNSISKKPIKNNITVNLDELYQNISSISAEYYTITKKESNYLTHSAEFIEDSENGHYLKIKTYGYEDLNELPNSRKLSAYKGLKKVEEGKNFYYKTSNSKKDFQQFIKQTKAETDRSLISDFYVDTFSNNWFSRIPLSGKQNVFNEEMCIMLAYFHLSNVIRYNPEHLYKLMDSKYWSIILGLRKHGFLKFEKLMWGNFIKKSFDVS